MSDRNSYLDFLRDRRSIRKYLHKEVPLELIDRVVEMAGWAPSAHNAQPWRFFVLRHRKIKEKLAKEMAKRFQEDLEKDGVSHEVAVVRARDSLVRFSTSPVIIVACVDMRQMDHYPDPYRQRAEEVMATQSLAAALQNLLLSATACGLGGCWFCAPLFCPELVKEIIGIPADYIPQGMITLGYPDEAPTPPRRLSLNEIRKIV